MYSILESMRNNSILIYLLLLLGYISLVWLNNFFILTEDLYYSSFGEQLTIEKIEQLFSFQTEFSWINYIVLPFSILIKTSIITLVIYTGVILSSLKVGLSRLFRIVIQAEFIFLLMGFVRFCWIYFFQTDNNFTSLGFFQPLSIINFFSPEDNLTYLVYPLQLINLFELAYWLLLAYLLSDLLKKSFWKSFEFVLSTYGFALVIWVVFVIFLTLNFSS